MPFLFKKVIDYLNEHTGHALDLSTPTNTVLTVAVVLMIACNYYDC